MSNLARCVHEFLQHGVVYVVLDETRGTLVTMAAAQYTKRRREIKGKVYLTLWQAEAEAARLLAMS